MRLNIISMLILAAAVVLALGNTATAQAGFGLGPFEGYPGDFNLDGSVDVLNDAFILVGNLGSPGGFTDGDLSGDGFVDQVDLAFFVGFGLIGTENVIPGDANGDGVVDVLGDAFLIVGNLGTETPGVSVDNFRQGDINSDGIVDTADLALLVDLL